VRRLVLLLFLALAAPAQAAPVPLARVDSDSTVALAGDRALFTRVRGRVLTVYSIPVGGGTPRREFAYTRIAGANRISAVLAASAQRVALAVLMERDLEWVSAQAFTGVLGAPWTALGPRARTGATLSVQVDGDRLFGIELRDRFGNYGATAYGPAPQDVPFYGPLDAASAVFAGDLVAYPTAAPGAADEPSGVSRRVTVRDWRTGAERAAMDFQEPVTSLALKPDGTTLVTDLGGAVFVWTPGSAPRRVAARGGAKARFAGTGVVVGNEHGPRLNGRPLGAPTESGGDLAADDRHVLYTANECLFIARVTDADTGPPGPGGPCPRTEIEDVGRSSQPFRRTLKVRLRCVHAPVRCKGTVRLMGTTRRFVIPVGRVGTVRVPLTAAAYRTIQRWLAREPDDPRDTSIFVRYRARTDDGAEIPRYVPTISIDRPGATTG
jgi:hypothetical protein